MFLIGVSEMGLILLLLLIYLVPGLIVGLGFVLRGVNRVDEVAAHSPMVFRLMILPGSIGLWPVVLMMWIHSGKAAKGDRH